MIIAPSDWDNYPMRKLSPETGQKWLKMVFKAIGIEIDFLHMYLKMNERQEAAVGL